MFSRANKFCECLDTHIYLRLSTQPEIRRQPELSR